MILNILKPKGITSHDVVYKVRKITGEKKVGHGGTLDPQASGVLIVGVGKESTKKLQEVLKGTDKEYEAVVELGKTSSTDDSEGEIKTTQEDLSNIDEKQILETLRSFKGEIEQTPPQHSALKIEGTPAYKLARKGEKVDLAPRKVDIKEIELIELNLPYIKIRTLVSSGTYIRSLARDIGEKLSAGAYLKELVRTSVGEFKLEDALSLEELSITCKKFNTKDI